MGLRGIPCTCRTEVTGRKRQTRTKKTKMKRDIGDRLIRLHDAQLKFAVVAEFPVFLDRIGRDPSVGSSAEIGTYANATSFPIISLWLVMRRPISRHGGPGEESGPL